MSHSLVLGPLPGQGVGGEGAVLHFGYTACGVLLSLKCLWSLAPTFPEVFPVPDQRASSLIRSCGALSSTAKMEPSGSHLLYMKDRSLSLTWQ